MRKIQFFSSLLLLALVMLALPAASAAQISVGVAIHTGSTDLRDL